MERRGFRPLVAKAWQKILARGQLARRERVQQLQTGCLLQLSQRGVGHQGAASIELGGRS